MRRRTAVAARLIACIIFAPTHAAPVAPWLPWRFIGGDSFGPSTNFPHPAGGGAPYGAISAYNTEDTGITPNTLHPISMRFGVSGTAANSRREAHKRAREARTERFKNGKGGGTLDPYEPPAPAAAALAQTPRVPPHEQRQAASLQEEAQWPGRLHPPWWWEKPPDWVRELPWWLSGNTEDLKDHGDFHPTHKKAAG